MPITYSAPAVKTTIKIIEYYGIDSKPLLENLRIDSKEFNNPSARFPYPIIEQLWEDAQTLSGDSAFGLKADLFWHPSQLGALGYAWLSSKSLKCSIKRFQRYSRILTEGAIFKIRETDNSFSLILNYLSISKQQPTRTDSFMAMFNAMCRANYGSDFHPQAIHLTHPKPDDIEPFIELFQCPIYFGTTENCFTISMETALKPLEDPHPQLAELNDQVVTEFISMMDNNNIVEKVKHEITKQLSDGLITDKTVSKALAMHKRTLQRKLQEQHTTFKTLLNEVRQTLANVYIDNHSMPLTEISYLLGFSNLSSFSRAFKRWTGTSPANYRKE